MAGEDKNVIIAYDGSPNAEYALDWYVKNVYRPGKHVVLFHVPEIHVITQTSSWTSPVTMDPRTVAALLQEEQNRVQNDLEIFADKLRSLSIGGKVKSVAASKPGEAIVEEANESHAELVVAGTRGLGKIRRTLVGSVSDYLVHHCNCPVLVVKIPKNQ
ncbi:hypothetical protein BaRGS_00029454 [Batillaria attramentaria]|uniref:UspA domain-containing protein n=1 Tax=Batillaria attramentaria TaxID=370345 RepID=A0ABD0JW26_9CAEN